MVAESKAPRLRRVRQALGVSLKEIAAQTGYPVAALEKLEEGGIVRTMQVSRVAAALGVDPAILTGARKNPFKDVAPPSGAEKEKGEA